jgi:rhamnogalacturonyl hydrolase YesR/outer membrane protein assembly factor BamB/predicted MPP superfamily phosphohydrolase
MKKQLLLVALIMCIKPAAAQHTDVNFQFALVSDTHIGGEGADKDLLRTVSDINANDSLDFVIISGDVTEFGSDRELLLAKEILDGLNKPWYIIPGNHDTKWSESGSNSFRRIFGSEAFAFSHDGYLFIGTNSGPNMRMGPGQIPRENIVWLDSVLNFPENRPLKIISVNHYPLDNGLNNWYELTDRLKKGDVRLALCGHGHSNRVMDFEGIPALMARSNLHAKDSVGGYNIMRFSGDTVLTAAVRMPGVNTFPSWASVKITRHDYGNDTTTYPRPDFSVNRKYTEVKEVWRVQEKSDIGSGSVMTGGLLITTGTDGYVRALDAETGLQKWRFATGAKIYSTPAAGSKSVIVAATDGMVYALKPKSGKKIWSFDSQQPMVASPVIHGDRVYVTGSSGKCCALRLGNGSVIWRNGQIDGFVETTPVVYKGMLIFGTWNNHMYAIDTETGKIKWDWNNGYTNRMLSPAACVPVAANDRVFVVAPDRKMACLDAFTGRVIWHSDLGGNTIRESMGISADSSLVYAKTMDGKIIRVSIDSPEGVVEATSGVNIGYDIAPGVIKEQDGVVFIPSDDGFIYAIAREDGRLLWEHRISSCLINQILPTGSNSFVCSSMDGVITRLSYSVTESDDLTHWPVGSSPQEIGLRIANKFLDTPHGQLSYLQYEATPTQITYSEACTWLGGLWFAGATGNADLLAGLRQRFDPLFDTDRKLLPPPNHVDNNVFGAVPLELFMQTKEKRYLELGTNYADTQWLLPADAGDRAEEWHDQGYTWQTRLWIDDMFMITAVQSQAYRATGNPEYIDRAAHEMVLYLDSLQLDNGLFYHSPSAHFCWGRGNGWMAAGMAEILRALPAGNADRPRILEGYRKMMAALIRYQADDGMWRQVIDDDTFWKETSSTAMFTYAMITGVKEGWLDSKTYGSAARKAWLALITYINKDDNMTEVCEGTGTSSNRDHYMNRGRNTGDPHGQAPMLWCAAALLR